ncbi:hypothetical protein [Pseudomonas sp. QTF5]|uniref:hypothetical protein n=1 Tax=Pseudomonas sp. QTF5 TaxID=1435425 RepID=UPI0004BE32AB|nr:hypothetical protein [Pseudomonas sp. QTF5]
MKKQHGPAFRKQLIELAQCPACRGKAVIKGVFHEMECIQCNASGWVVAETGEALQLQDLVMQLSFKLQEAQRKVEALKRASTTGIGKHYELNNRLGAGGSNYTGD